MADTYHVPSCFPSSPTFFVGKSSRVRRNTKSHRVALFHVSHRTRCYFSFPFIVFSLPRGIFVHVLRLLQYWCSLQPVKGKVSHGEGGRYSLRDFIACLDVSLGPATQNSTYGKWSSSRVQADKIYSTKSRQYKQTRTKGVYTSFPIPKCNNSATRTWYNIVKISYPYAPPLNPFAFRALHLLRFHLEWIIAL